MDLGRLRALRELSIRGTMAAVSEALLVSPSAISQQMTLLEQEVGAPLIEKRGRGVALTVAGQILVDRAERIFAELVHQAQAHAEHRAAAVVVQQAVAVAAEQLQVQPQVVDGAVGRALAQCAQPFQPH
jgi:DNA-binding transcriptional LysR family regulator